MGNPVTVFLFTGFLGAGKTTFIQQALENAGFCTGDPTLLLVCEEGEEAFEPERFANTGVTIQTILNQAELNPEQLEAFLDAAQATRVLIEYNGMWTLDALTAAMPQNWYIFREMAFFDSGTFLTYNSNLRPLVYDKLKRCDVVAFTAPDSPNADRELFHKIVRGASRRAGIAYQYQDTHTEYDDIVDQDPFDLTADIVEIGDDDYAYWSRDITEDPQKYDNKTVQLKCQIILREDLPAGTVGIGRYVMVCCENDIQFVGFICEDIQTPVDDNAWMILQGTIHLKFHTAYGRVAPVFTCISAESCAAPESPVATF